MARFASATHSNFEGITFRVTVCGKFAPIALLGDAFTEMYMVFVPESIEIIADAKHKAQICRDVLKLDQAIDDKSSIRLRQILERSSFLLTVDILSNVLMLYRGHDIEESELKSLSELLIKLNDIEIVTQVLFNIREMKINMKAIFALIYLDLMELDIDKMIKIKLRRICKKYEEGQYVGQVLVEYQTNGILRRLQGLSRQQDEQVDWVGHIDNYVSKTLRYVKTATIPLTAKPSKRMSLEKRIENCVVIMQKYDAIINHETAHDDAMDEKEEVTYDELNVVKLRALFQSIDDEIGISELMDTVFDLKKGDTQYVERIKQHHQCKLTNECNILKSIIKTRNCGLRSRIPYRIKRTKSKLDDDQTIDPAVLHAREFCVMELLDFVHIKLFHKEEHYRPQLPNRTGITVYDEFEEHADDDEDDVLFMDSLNDYPYLKEFCVENEYDSEAIAAHILYHGLDRLFNTQGLVNQFYGALSTTPELTIARNFAGASGMILQINKDVNFKNANAIAVSWISRHDHEEEVLLMNPQVIIQKSYVFLKDTALKTSYLKEILLSVLVGKQHASIFYHLSAFFQSRWIASCLENIVKDTAFMGQIDLFAKRDFLKEMTLFEFIFFECRQYQIATYINQYEYRTETEVFAMLIGNTAIDFLHIDNDGWVQSVDRSNKYCAQYQPRMCTMNITYTYSEHRVIVKSFTTKEGKQMLLDTNLILQHIDQRKLNTFQEGLTISIDMEIKYQHKYTNGTKCPLRVWRYKVIKFVPFTIEKNFNWWIRNSTNLTLDTLCVSSLRISDNSAVTCVSGCNGDESKRTNYSASVHGQLRIFCAETLTIDNGCSISMDECGVKGASGTLYETPTRYNGECGVQCGGGGGYMEKGQDGLIDDEKVDGCGGNKYLTDKMMQNNKDPSRFSIGFGGGGYMEKGQDGLIDDEKVDGCGGNKYLTDKMMQNNKDPSRFSIGFGGGCGQSVGSRGGNGGGKIYILCNELRIEDGGKMSANGGNGVQYGGGGSGGSILVTANKTNVVKKDMKKLSVIGGLGDNGGGTGSAGIVQFGVFDESTTLTFMDTFQPNTANIAMYGVVSAMFFH
eukprot:1042172_1